MPYLSPSTSIPLVTVSLQVPEEFFHIVQGALLELTYVENWEEYGTLTPEECAALMSIAFDTITKT